MDGAHRPARGKRSQAAEDEAERIRRRFAEVVGGQPPSVDVSSYLLDPPPSAEEHERQERRRLLVRRGSVALAAVLAVLLLAPWPGDGAPPPAPGDDVAAPLPAEPSQPQHAAAPALPERVDDQPAARRPRQRVHRSRRSAAPRPSHARVAAPRSDPPAVPAAAPARAPTPAPAPAPSSPPGRPDASEAPAPQDDGGAGGELVPVF